MVQPAPLGERGREAQRSEERDTHMVRNAGALFGMRMRSGGLLVLLVMGAALVASFAFAGLASGATGYTQTGTFGSLPTGDPACPAANPGEFCNPGRIAVDEGTGNVYVVDQGS